MASRIGVDIGGTFTDFILYNEKDNSITIDKIPTTPQEPQKAVVEVVKRNLNEEKIKEIDFFLHGTTGSNLDGFTKCKTNIPSDCNKL